jgi:GWxTD domain-containing protein
MIRGAYVIGVLVGLVTFFGAPRQGWAQVEASQNDFAAIEAAYYMDALTFFDPASGKSRIDVYVHVGYDVLSFVKEGELYGASYEMTVSVQDSTGALVSEKLWTDEISGVSFDESVSPNAYRLSQRTFIVPPGMYQVSVHMRDLESKTTRKLVRPVRVPQYSGPGFSLSDIMLVSRITEHEGRRSIVPNITWNVGNLPDAFYIFFEVYDQQQRDSLLWVVTVFDAQKEAVLSLDTLLAISPASNDVLLRIPNQSLSLGDYSVVVRAYPPDSTAVAEDELLGSTSRYFAVRWEGLPKAVKDLDVAINQVRYIAREGELDELEEAKTPEEKQAAFLAFWKRRDPNPNTARNERMEEYYRRVAYANKEFSHYIEGWRTDMGMVYIMFGPPNDVSRHPFEVDTKPYEVWRYYKISYDFVFVDQSGFGDYRLLTPIWEAWQRAGRQTGW